MNKIKKIVITGFRGIKNTFEVDFSSKGNSIIIYGRNGTGKSSITDAWEWALSKEIEHLKRENAGPSSYPHKEANETSVTIEANIDKQELAFNVLWDERNVIISDESHYNNFKELNKYPCYLRQSDLQRFVLMTKTNKYEYLMKYLGLNVHLKTQNDLRTYYGKLTQKEEESKDILNRLINDICNTLNITQFKEEIILQELNSNLSRYKIPIDKLSESELNTVLERFKDLVDKNPISKELDELKRIQKEYSNFLDIPEFVKEIEDLKKLFDELNKNQENFKKLILGDIYSNSLEYLNRDDIKDKNICPVCEQERSNLINFLEKKSNLLQELKEQKSCFDDLQERLKSKFDKYIITISNIKEINNDFVTEKNSSFNISLKLLNSLKNNCEIDILDIRNFKELTNSDRKLIFSVLNDEVFTDKLNNKVDKLEKPTSEDKLSEVFQKISTFNDLISEYWNKDEEYELLKFEKESFRIIFSEFTSYVKSRLNKKFDIIKEDISNFFNVLENNTSRHLSSPKIELLDTNKAIEIEIGIEDSRVSPAFKIMSESQVNSLGLSVFLACIKTFNNNLKFIILDDIVSSLDGHKKDNLLKLLNDYFRDYQILMLTHDNLWFNKVRNKFRNWKIQKFTGWKYNHGPITINSGGTIEDIREDISEDDSHSAGHKLGVYLECELQDINEKIKSNVKYKSYNEYTLSELLNSFRARIKDVLGSSHDVCMIDLDTSFRNFVDHHKNLEGNVTTEDIRNALEEWQKVESILKCNECNEYVLYDDVSKKLRCECLIKILEKQKN